MEPRNTRNRWEPTPSSTAEGHGAADNPRRDAAVLPPGSESSARSHMPSAREPGGLGRCLADGDIGRQAREGDKPQAAGAKAPQPHASEESDALIVPTCKKSANSRVTPEESMEGRSAANGKSARGTAKGTQRPQVYRAHVTERAGERVMSNSLCR
jgi:hypothetical protein